MPNAHERSGVEALIGRSLGQLALGAFEFQLHLDCNISIAASQWFEI